MTHGKEPGSDNSTAFMIDGPIRGLLLASAKARMTLALVISAALWLGFFWATGSFGAS